MVKRIFLLLAVLVVIFTPVFVYIKWSGTTQPTVQYGEGSIEGIITGTGISLIRRGTHILTTAHGNKYFVQSNSVELDQYEGQRVKLQGRIEPNVSTDFWPLIIVDSLTPLEAREPTEQWSVPALGLTLSAPKSWKATITNGTLMFETPESNSPLLIVQRFNGTIPVGDAVLVGSKPSIRVMSTESSDQDVYVKGISGAILLQFTPPISASGTTYASAFKDLMKSVRFTISYASFDATATGSTLTCGGVAGILCPMGSYCDVRDQVTNTGICRKSR